MIAVQSNALRLSPGACVTLVRGRCAQSADDQNPHRRPTASRFPRGFGLRRLSDAGRPLRRSLARRLARREHRSIADIVERALEAYEIREAGREPASAFYARLANDYGSHLDLEAVIRQNREVNPGPEL